MSFDSCYPDDQLQVFWDRISAGLNPFVYVLPIAGVTYRMLDEGAKLYMARKFMKHVTESVMFCRDGGGDGEGNGGAGRDRYYLGPPRFFMAGSGMVVHAVGTDEAVWVKRAADGLQHIMVVPPGLPNRCSRIPRPPNAYILYRKDRHRMLKASQPGISNNDISRVLGRAWNQESAEVRLKYKLRADEIKQALIERHPDYKYRPRRSDEVRRRNNARAAQGSSVDAFVHATVDDQDVVVADPAAAVPTVDPSQL
ncbi:hypothetical protein QQZ08_004482 [Neonectria magnoliae]|uniref:HMG box domain-containing protein n=1 Tax=Neonectria magnoliae TaxID=2732573 RepID=A0ABR1I614_9HYPO